MPLQHVLTAFAKGKLWLKDPMGQLSNKGQPFACDELSWLDLTVYDTCSSHFQEHMLITYTWQKYMV